MHTVRPIPALPDHATRAAIRRMSGLTQRQIAAELDVSPGSVAMWEINRSPAGRNRRAYAELLVSLRRQLTGMVDEPVNATIA